MKDSAAIIFYDGMCGLCDRSIQFIIKHDHRKVFRFAALQSNFARSILKEDVAFDSFIYFENGRIFTHSSGALMTFKKLGGAWSILYLFMIVPPFIRDAIYRWVAKNRYKWFGKFDSCKLPTPEQKSRFIE